MIIANLNREWLKLVALLYCKISRENKVVNKFFLEYIMILLPLSIAYLLVGMWLSDITNFVEHMCFHLVQLISKRFVVRKPSEYKTLGIERE